MKLSIYEQPWGVRYIFYCPGCKCHHSFDVYRDGYRPNWSFDGNLESPTFTPSLHYPQRVCHLFVTAGKTVEMEDVE